MLSKKPSIQYQRKPMSRERTKGLWYKFPLLIVIGTVVLGIMLVYRGYEKVKGVVTHEERTDKPALES